MGHMPNMAQATADGYMSSTFVAGAYCTYYISEKTGPEFDIVKIANLLFIFIHFLRLNNCNRHVQ